MTINYLTPDDLAKRWKTTSGTLRNWRSDGIGPIYLRLPGKVLYREQDVLAFENGSMHSSTKEKVIGGPL